MHYGKSPVSGVTLTQGANPGEFVSNASKGVRDLPHIELTVLGNPVWVEGHEHHRWSVSPFGCKWDPGLYQAIAMSHPDSNLVSYFL